MTPLAVGSRPVQRLTYAVGSTLLGGYVRLRIEGGENRPAHGPFLLVSNHCSHFDPPLLTWAVGQWVDWAAMVELFQRRWLARYWDALAVFPVDRSKLDRHAAVTALRRLRGGRVVGIFPEGGIRKGDASVLAGGTLDAGACRLAVAAGVPLLPAVISGSERLYTAGGWLFPRHAFQVQVRFGTLLVSPGEQGSGKAAAEALNARLGEALRGLAGLPSGAS